MACSGGPVALHTRALTSSTAEDLRTLASLHLSLFRPHNEVHLMMPTFTPVGTGSLLHDFVNCDSADQSLALLDGRAIAQELIVHAARIPVSCSLAELAVISRDLWAHWPNRHTHAGESA